MVFQIGLNFRIPGSDFPEKKHNVHYCTNKISIQTQPGTDPQNMVDLRYLSLIAGEWTNVTLAKD